MANTAAFEAYLDRYEAWFEKNIFVYPAELRAIKSFLPPDGKGLEIGVGSGLFAAPLGIRHGVEPSRAMTAKARERGIAVTHGVAEALPFGDAVFDFALMVTTVCFLDDMDVAFSQTNRVLKPGGTFVIGFVDKNSPIGKAYERYKKQSVFYKDATFYAVDDLLSHLTKAGFGEFSIAQTVFGMPSDIPAEEPVKPGYGEGSFVVIKAMKQLRDIMMPVRGTEERIALIQTACLTTGISAATSFPGDIEIITGDAESRVYADKLKQVLLHE